MLSSCLRRLPILAALAVAPFALAQTPPPQTPPTPRRQRPNQPLTPPTVDPNGGPGQNPGLQGGRNFGGRPNAGPRPYDEVITKDAKSAPGVFTVHRINDQVLFDIPKGELGKEAPSVEPIAATFPVEAEGKDGAVVVDVTRFFKQCRLSATAKTPDAPPLVPE